METGKPTPINVGDLEHRKVPEFRRIYCNSLGVGMTSFDVSLNIGEVINEDGKPIVEDHAVITMSWEHLKAMYDALSRILQNRESMAVNAPPKQKP